MKSSKIACFAGFVLIASLNLGFGKSKIVVPSDFSLRPGVEKVTLQPNINVFLHSENPLKREQGKILFLIFQISDSPHQFIRNGDT